jgi:hypothetical protein
MNYQASMSRYTPTPPPDYVAAEEALGTIRDTLTVHLDKVWKLALTDDHTVRCTLALPPLSVENVVFALFLRSIAYHQTKTGNDAAPLPVCGAVSDVQLRWPNLNPIF